MPDTVAAYWDARAETPDEAASKLSDLLQAIATAAPATVTWYEKGTANPGPDDAVDAASVAALSELFAEGANRRDTDRTEIAELGYRVSLWNGDNADPVEVTTQAGVTSTTPGITNSVVLKVPSTVSWRTAAPTLFTDIASIWNADRALWMTRDYRRTQPQVDGATLFGWLTYLTADTAERVTDVPPDVTTEPIANGTLFTAGNEPGEASQALAAHMAASISS